MGKSKLIALITCGALIAGGIGTTTLVSNKTTSTNTKIENHILFSAPATSNQAVVININNSPLVLYSEANSNSSITSYLSIGEMLTYQPTNNANFYKVTVQETGATGYISANNIQIIQSGLNQAFNSMNRQGQVINVTHNVILRSQPDMQGTIMGNYRNNTPVRILGKQGQWYKVLINGQTGYMYQEYIGLTNTSNTNISNTSTSNTNTSNTNTPNTNNPNTNTSNTNTPNTNNPNTNTSNTNSSNTNVVTKNNSTKPIKNFSLNDVQNIISNQMGDYFKNKELANTPTKDLDIPAIYQTTQAIIPQFVTQNTLQNVFKLNGPTYSNIKIKSYFSSSKVPNMINIPERQWSTTGNGYYVVSIQNL